MVECSLQLGAKKDEKASSLCVIIILFHNGNNFPIVQLIYIIHSFMYNFVVCLLHMEISKRLI